MTSVGADGSAIPTRDRRPTATLRPRPKPGHRVAFDNGANPETCLRPARVFMPGLVQAALAYILWGLFPIYFHALSRVDAF